MRKQWIHFTGAALGALSLIAIPPVRCVAQSQAAPPLSGVTSLPTGNNGQSRVAGKGLDAGGLVVVPEDFSKITISPGFLLSMQVYDMPEISTDLRVNDDGDVAVPMSGKVHVAGLTLPEAEHAIEQRLGEKQILRNPEINLDVAQYAADNVSVIGEVQTPGRIQLLSQHSLPDVLAMVGGETQLAGDTVIIRRTVNGQQQVQKIGYARSGNSDDIKNVMIQPGDTVVVPRAGIVYVLGGVNRPGGYVMQEDGTLDVAQALSLAYGTALNAAVGSIRIVRKRPDGSLQEIPVSYRKITKGKEVSPRLQAEDILYVPVSKLKSIATAGLVGTTSSALIYTQNR
jgi:polysaccharide biosynthesis/export protein